MKRWQSVLLIAAAGALNSVSGIQFGGKWGPFIGLGLTAAQMAIASKTSKSNPDGTPATMPYNPPQKPTNF